MLDDGAIGRGDPSVRHHFRDSVSDTMRITDLAAPRKIPPGTGWRKFVYSVSFHKINPGESPRERHYRNLQGRIRRHIRRQYVITVVSGKGGVGVTTMAACIGGVFRECRPENVIAIDAVPSFGTLADRIDESPPGDYAAIINDTDVQGYADIREHLGQNRIFLITVALALLTASPASAITPPPIDPGALPPDVTGPDQPTEQRVLCASPTTLPGSGFHDPPWSNTYLGVADAHKFATGAGVTVAVIDTGVDASPRVPAEPGGDFVDQAGNGLSDCDAHGTLTASIIAGRPAPTDGFVGVAPDARLLSLRQTSEAFEPVGSQANPNDPNATPAAGSIRSLARAVVHAANLGVGVINISEAACYKVSRPIDETSLGASIDYAVNVKGVVVVVAAGNTGGDCVQNPAPDPSTPGDPRGWNNVQTVVTPAWYAPLVLSVGGIGQTGMPSSFSMHGPWVDVAAPAENIVALGDTGEPVNALQGREGPVPIAGTSFAAAYVSGLAALLRQRFPDLTPAQIIHRITATARHPGGGVDDLVGAGVIDAVAALTWDIPPGPASAPYNVRRLPPPVVEPGPDRRPITAVALVAVGLTLALGLGALARRALSRR